MTARALRRLDLPPVWAALAAFASWGLSVAFPAPALDLGPVPPLLLGGAGVALVLWSALAFRRARTPIEPRHDARVLLTGGPFRINRNPIYTGLALILAGFALHLGSLAAWLPVAAFPAVVTRRFVLDEEARLRRAFGAEAEAWIARSRRW
ncbi:MAG: isoprenylcysteine carboxylmethyltransferase family protein [Paracoccaceae bacterium]